MVVSVNLVEVDNNPDDPLIILRMLRWTVETHSKWPEERRKRVLTVLALQNCECALSCVPLELLFEVIEYMAHMPPQTLRLGEFCEPKCSGDRIFALVEGRVVRLSPTTDVVSAYGDGRIVSFAVYENFLVASVGRSLEIIRISDGSVLGCIDVPGGADRVAATRALLLASSRSDDLVFAYDWGGSQVRAFGSFHLRLPRGLCVHENEVFVANPGQGCISVFRLSTGEFQRHIGKGTEAYFPLDVCVGGGMVFLADSTGHCIEVFSLSDGAHVTTIGGFDETMDVGDVCFSEDGVLYAACLGNILTFDILGSCVLPGSKSDPGRSVR